MPSPVVVAFFVFCLLEKWHAAFQIIGNIRICDIYAQGSISQGPHERNTLWEKYYPCGPCQGREAAAQVGPSSADIQTPNSQLDKSYGYVPYHKLGGHIWVFSRCCTFCKRAAGYSSCPCTGSHTAQTSKRAGTSMFIDQILFQLLENLWRNIGFEGTISRGRFRA
jgi:hypothetical protein